MAKEIEIKWLSEPQDHDYPSAKSYLRLVYNDPTAKTHVEKLKRARMTKFKSKDIFRASGLSLLGVSNYPREKRPEENQSRSITVPSPSHPR